MVKSSTKQNKQRKGYKFRLMVTNSYAYVSVEALNIKNMTKSAKGTVDKPGK
jgi:hypothetical protein